MRNDLPFVEPGGGDDLLYQAMLYASGELDGIDAAAFEQRLGEDQAARDALCQAVEMTQSLGGEAPPTPDPGYRSGVRHRLRQRRRHRIGLTQTPGSVFTHPAFWSILGSAITLLLLVLVSQMIALSDWTTPVPPTVRPTSMESVRIPEVEVTPATANVWADLYNNDHLARARAEELRRKLRVGRVAAEPENGKN